jgi:hypothetical protein
MISGLLLIINLHNLYTLFIANYSVVEYISRIRIGFFRLI